ncbi:MAG: YcjX family protein [Planctomycetaceae bacterium]|nr:YcjX family protein [Planctomycetaceae bacterium]
MRWLANERRIALTGLAGSGKTVFLLSLLQHLEHFDPDRFHIAHHARIGAFRELPVRGDFEPLPRTQLRARLMEGQNVGWPEKTRDIYNYRCSFDYSRLGMAGRLWNTVRNGAWLGERVEWDILDFPGERLSDALIARHHSYEDWSDDLLSLWDSYDRLRDLMREYHDLLAKPVPPVDVEVTDTYKRCLARMVHNKNQMITPSTFMLGTAGDGVFSLDDVETGGKHRYSGLPGAEFSPLPRGFREANAGLAARFAEYYHRYRETVVSPLFDAINGCDTLLVLIDVPGILSGGVGRFNDTNHLIETLAGNIIPSGFFTTHVDKVGFVASKADMVHARDQDNMRELVEDMMRIARNKQPGVRRYESFVASSWVSAESVDLDDGSRALRGIPARDHEVRVFRVPELKPDWPADWPPEDPRYSYPRLSPPPLANRFLAPEQRNLDRIFDFIVS